MNDVNEQIEPLFSCQNEVCARHMTHPAHHLNVFNDLPICQECFDDEYKASEGVEWDDLPHFVPAFEKKIRSQQEEIERFGQVNRYNMDWWNAVNEDRKKLQARNKELHRLVQKSFWDGFESCAIRGDNNIQRAWEASHTKQNRKALAGAEEVSTKELDQ